uniref:Uncharacterized protein n=1 Tax=Rhizophora mucronata TaxID=61149 RepID=A0A2P2R3P7_RHIMU
MSLSSPPWCLHQEMSLVSLLRYSSFSLLVLDF